MDLDRCLDLGLTKMIIKMMIRFLKCNNSHITKLCFNFKLWFNFVRKYFFSVQSWKKIGPNLNKSQMSIVSKSFLFFSPDLIIKCWKMRKNTKERNRTWECKTFVLLPGVAHNKLTIKPSQLFDAKGSDWHFILSKRPMSKKDFSRKQNKKS